SAAGGGGVRRADAASARAVRAHRRLRRRLPPARRGPGPVPARARGGRDRGGGQRRARAAPARRVLARAARLRRMAQAPRPVALLPQVRGPPPRPPHPRRRLPRHLPPLPLRGPAESLYRWRLISSRRAWAAVAAAVA